MLSSLTRHFNDTVFRGPDTEGGGGDDIQTDADLGDSGGGDGGDISGGDDSGESGESARPLTVREELKKAIAETSEPAPKAKKEKTSRVGDNQRGKEAAPVAPAAPATNAVPAPESLPKEVKAEWDKTPPAIQAAFVKREADMAKGVEELKSRYSLIDQAIAPHNDALRQMNATPGEAVNRMFLWFKALAGSPQQAFPELAKSMGIDWTRLITPQGQAQEAAQGTGSGTPPEIPEPVKAYVGTLENQVKQLTQYVQQIGNRFGSVEQNLNTQNEARTKENLNIWSTGKTYFEDVRQDMARLIETGIVPLKDGQVDLDTAYERAIYLNPEVRAKVLAEQQQANQQVQQTAAAATTAAQQTQVNKARKASVSLPSSSPGNTSIGNGAMKKKPGERTPVRESLKQAIATLRDQ